MTQIARMIADFYNALCDLCGFVEFSFAFLANLAGEFITLLIR